MAREINVGSINGNLLATSSIKNVVTLFYEVLPRHLTNVSLLRKGIPNSNA